MPRKIVNRAYLCQHPLILGGIIVGLASGYVIHLLLAPYARDLKKEKSANQELPS